MFLIIKEFFRREWRRTQGEFKQLWENYIYQSLIAVIVLAIVLLALSIEQAVIIASIGATAFIVFTMPDNITAGPRGAAETSKKPDLMRNYPHPKKG